MKGLVLENHRLVTDLAVVKEEMLKLTEERNSLEKRTSALQVKFREKEKNMGDWVESLEKKTQEDRNKLSPSPSSFRLRSTVSQSPKSREADTFSVSKQGS